MMIMDTLKTTVESALKEAMRANDDVRRRTLRMVLAAIKLSEIEKHSSVDDNAIITILQKEVKNRRESIQEAQKANRPDLIAENEAEINVLNGFLPQPLTMEELDKLIQSAIEEVGAKAPSDIGKVMKVLLPRVQGKAPGDQVSQAVRKYLLPAN
jgi:uncharacterized protein